MAIRFGGPHSPGQNQDAGEVISTAPDRSLRQAERRTTWILIAAAPLLVGAFFQGPTGMALHLAGFAVLALGMHVTRLGARAAAAYDARQVARRPAVPRKLVGGILTGLGLAIGAARPEMASIPGAAVIGIVAALLHRLCFGADPWRDKGMDSADAVQIDRTTRFLEEGEARLAEMNAAILRLGDAALARRVGLFSDTARRLFRQVQDDPARLSAARRYLGVYLTGARDATIKFAEVQARSPDPSARASWEALMSDLDTNFAARTRELLAGSRTDMEIEISVLRERLAQEGVRPDEEPAQQQDGSPGQTGSARP